MVDQNNILFSFDIGTNSIGWCVFRLEDSGSPNGLLDSGVRIYSDGRDAKTKTSLAAGRRDARAASRRRDRMLWRKKATLRTLIEYGLMPADPADRRALIDATRDRKRGTGPSRDVYELRRRALDEKLGAHEIGRVLFHLGQRRGFKSNRKTDRRDNEKGKIASGIDRLRDEMHAHASETLGEYLAQRRATGKTVRLRSGGSQAEVDGYPFYPARSDLEEEFHRIWSSQARWHAELLNQARRDHLFTVMFYQRPLKKPLVGRCLYHPDEKRLPRAHPLFQEFRLLKEVNELRLVLPDQSSLPLTLEQRDALLLKLRSVRKSTYAALRRVLKLPRDYRFNKETENRKDMAGDEIAACLGGKGPIGSAWSQWPLERQWALVSLLRDEEDPERLLVELRERFGVDGETARAAADVVLPDGYGRHGETALRKIVNQLRLDVIPESDAVQRSGYRHSDFRDDDDPGHDRLPAYQEILRRNIPPGTGDPNDIYDVRMGRITNPTVHIGLNQLRRVVNALIAKHGKPAEIALELARDLKLSERQKADVNRTIGENTRAARRRSEKISELQATVPGLVDNGYNRLLLKLWEELNPDNPEDRVCIYSGQPIGIRMLFSGAVDVDHILPFSRTLDDSQGNKILCLREANRAKRNRAPAEVTEWEANYDAILERVARLPRNKRWRFGREAMEQFDTDQKFLARQLTDTQYLSRLAADYLGCLFPKEEVDDDGVVHRRRRVRVIPGRLTEMLRRHWGLNSLLPDHNYAETVQVKNRKDHRHHTIDAAVVGVSGWSMLQRISKAVARRESQDLEQVIGDLPAPWEGFRDDLKQSLEQVTVSHKADHGTVSRTANKNGKGQTAGRLHNDTAYGLTGETDARGNSLVVRRKPFLELSTSDIARIRDDELRQRLVGHVGELSGKALQAALLAFSREDAKYRGIRHVRLIEPLRVIPIHDQFGRPYKSYKGDANYRYDVWAMPDGTWKHEVVTMFDAHQPGWESEIRRNSPTARKVLSLRQNDMVAFEHPRLGSIIGLVVKFGQNGQITLVPHHEAGDLKRRDNAPDQEDPFKYYAPTVGGLRRAKARQVRVDEIGRVFDPGPRE